MEEQYIGKKFTIIHCKGAIDSFEIAIKSVEARKHEIFKANLRAQNHRLADGYRISSNSFRSEGKLSNGKKFYALKKIPIRGYCWLSTTKQSTYFISHYMCKKKDKLDRSDTEKVIKNWKRVEEDGYGR